MHQLHAGVVGGHLGEIKTLSKLKQHYYWPGHHQDVHNFVATCICSACATHKTPAPQTRAPLQNIMVGSPMQIVGVDLLGPFPQSHSGNRYLLDYFTKWAEAYPVRNMEANTVANVLTNELFFKFSPPEQIHSDQGHQFESKLLKEICKLLQTSPYNPQCDGLVERYNRTLLDMLSTVSKDTLDDWKQFVRPVCFAYNTSVQAFTGYTPYYLMYGREARLPVDLQFGTSSSDTMQCTETTTVTMLCLSGSQESFRKCSKATENIV